MSLVDLYEEILEQDQEKFAEEEQIVDEEETVKVAQEYDAVGRIMFRGFFDEMIKSAQEGGFPPAKEEKEEEDEEEEKKKEEEEKKKKEGGPPAGIQQMMAEKKASIMERMQQDPEYAQQLIDKYTQPE